MSTEIKKVLNWCLYAFLYAAIFILLFIYFPEQVLFNLIRRFYSGFIGEGAWDDIYMSTLFALSLLINCILIYIIEKVRSR